MNFNAAAIDLAKIGRLFVREGDWNGQRILDADWVRASVRPDSAAGRPRYGYLWWVRRGDGDGDANRYYAEGRFGQYIYVVPDRDLIVVRTGRSDGGVDWISVFERIVRRVDAVDQGARRRAQRAATLGNHRFVSDWSRRCGFAGR